MNRQIAIIVVIGCFTMLGGTCNSQPQSKIADVIIRKPWPDIVQVKKIAWATPNSALIVSGIFRNIDGSTSLADRTLQLSAKDADRAAAGARVIVTVEEPLEFDPVLYSSIPQPQVGTNPMYP